jgi:hypothetical protein
LLRKRRGRYFFTIDSVDCIIDTTGLPELMLETPNSDSHSFLASCRGEAEPSIV